MKGINVELPVKQIYSYKCMKGAEESDKYRLMLSDGIHSYSMALLNSALNHLIKDKNLLELSIVKIKKYSMTQQKNKKVLIIHDLEVVMNGDKVGSVIGHPTVIISQKLFGFNLTHFCAKKSYRIAEAQNITPYQSSDSIGSNTNVETPSKKQKEDLTSISNYNKTIESPSKMIHPIATLTPYQNRWCIKARVTSKGPLRTFSNSKGSGKLFGFNLLDESGEIRCTAYNDDCDKYFDIIETGSVFQISQCQIRASKPQYTSVKNHYEMIANSDSIILPCNDDASIPKVEFNFTKIAKIATVSPTTVVDVIGILLSSSDLNEIVSKQGKELKKRDIEIGDDSGFKVRLTLWQDQAEKFNHNGNPVVAVKSCKVSDYNGRSLGMNQDAQIAINPDIPESHTLAGWYNRVKGNTDFKDFKSGDMNDNMSSGLGTRIVSIAEIKEKNIENSTQPNYGTVMAFVIKVRYRENGLYKACTVCKKKLQLDENLGSLFCEKCVKPQSEYHWNLIMGVEIADSTDSIWVTSFKEASEVITGKPVEEIGAIKDELEDSTPTIEADLDRNLFKPFLFKLKSATENYNDEQRIKTSVTSCHAYNPVAYGRKLIQEISTMKLS